MLPKHLQSTVFNRFHLSDRVRNGINLHKNPTCMPYSSCTIFTWEHEVKVEKKMWRRREWKEERITWNYQDPETRVGDLGHAKTKGSAIERIDRDWSKTWLGIKLSVTASLYNPEAEKPLMAGRQLAVVCYDVCHPRKPPTCYSWVAWFPMVPRLDFQRARTAGIIWLRAAGRKIQFLQLSFRTFWWRGKRVGRVVGRMAVKKEAGICKKRKKTTEVEEIEKKS